MRIFLKNIGVKDIKYLKAFPIQGLVFSITQRNAEKVRDIIEQIPFYLTIIGEVDTSLKYEVEELIFFCKLQGVISKKNQEYSRPIILLNNPTYNVLINNNGKISTENINLKLLEEFNNIEALVLDIDEFLNFLPKIIHIWANYKVV
ncbi:MAG: hypothetical protein ACOYJ1_07365 [Peptococcales bacterium]|jgi:hypothetical protein